MQVTYQITESDFCDGQVTYRKRNFVSRWSWIGLVALLAVCTLFEATVITLAPRQRSLLSGWMIFSAICTVLLALLYWLGPRLEARKQYRNAPSAKGTVNLEILDNGLRFVSAASTGEAPWSHYLKCLEGKAVFLLFLNPRVFVLIPKRAFTAEQENQFRTLLAQNITR